MVVSVEAAVMTAPRHIEPGTRDLKPPGPDEVELQVGYVGLCGSDLAAFYGHSSLWTLPIVRGHEFSALVVRHGEHVRHVRVGQWVTVAPLLTCGTCACCRAGNEHLCPQRVIFGGQVDGALRRRLVMPAHTVFPLPEGISPQAGALTEPLAVAVHAVVCAEKALDSAQVIISGAGAIGLLVAQVAAYQGADRVLLLDIDERRLQFAHEMGFEAARPESVGSSCADFLFIATSAAESIRSIPDLLTPRGTAVVVGILNEAALDWNALLWKEGTVTTSRYFTLRDFEQALALQRSGAARLAPLIQDQAALDELFEAAGEAIMQRARRVIRLLIQMDPL